MKLRGHWRHISLVLALGAGVQVPAVVTLGKLTGRPLLVLAAAAILTTPFLAGLGNPWEMRPRSRLHLYGLLWPFFAWWTICMVFLLLGPVALVVAAASGAVSLHEALLGGALAALCGGLVALSRRPRIYRVEMPIANLPPAFVGYRIAQISDIHCGPFTPGRRVRRWVEQVNRLEPDLTAVTGDLITSGRDYVETVADCLAELRARDGVFGCMGNHDYFTDGESFARRLQERGLDLLRNRGVRLERQGQTLFLAGVDDTWTRRADLPRALRERPPGAPVVLLAHDPALFGKAAAAGVALTLSGHTHGGQFAFPLAARRWNLARFMTPFTTGHYCIGEANLYVNRGLGTTGPPVRLGARPEITLITLVPAGGDLTERLQHIAEEVIREVSIPPNPLSS